MSLINKKLKELKMSKDVVDVFRDNVCEESLTGIVGDFNNEHLALILLTEDGEAEGISVVFCKDITRVRSGGNLCSSIHDLSNYRSTKLTYPTINLATIDDVLQSIQSAFGYVNIYTESMNDNFCFIGEAIEHDENWVYLLEYGTMMSRDSHHMLLSKDEISRIDAGSKYEESIKFLFNKS